MSGNQSATIGNQTEAGGEHLLPIAEVVEMTGISERTLREYRKGIENALQRRITKRVPHGRTFKIYFLAESIQMFEDWRNRYSDEEFVGKYSSGEDDAIEADEVIEASLEEPEYGLTVYKQAPLDPRISQLMEVTEIQPTNDAIVTKADNQIQVLSAHLVNTVKQQVLNEATDFDRERVVERSKGHVEGAILFQERRAGRVEAVQELQQQEAQARHIAELEQQLAQAKGGVAKAATKSRKR